MEQTNLPSQTPISPEIQQPPMQPSPDTVQAMPSPKSSNMPMMLVAAVAVIALVAGAYYLGMQRNAQELMTQTSMATATPDSVITTPSSNTDSTTESTPTFVMTESFQDLLAKNCTMIDLGNGASVEAIKESLLPVAIDSQKLNVKYRIPSSLMCSGGDPAAKDDYVMVELQDKPYQSFINIYSSESQEMGHGGPSYLGSFDTVVKKEGNITYSIALIGSEGPTFTDTASVVMKAEKALNLSNGETLYVNAIEDAIPHGDPRLVEFLDKYAVDSEYEPGRREIGNVPMEDVQAKFFANPATVDLSVKNAMATLKAKLDGVTLK